MANRFDQNQINALKLAFQESSSLTKQKKDQLVADTGLNVEQVSSWFNRTRGKKRERECKNELEQALQESKEREVSLQQKLEESWRREAELLAEIQRLQKELRITPDDSYVNPFLLSPNRYE